MFIQVNGRPLNVYSIMYHYSRDVIKPDGTTSYNVYYRLTDGRIIEEEFSDASTRDTKITEVSETLVGGGLIQENTYSDFPEEGKDGILYLAKDTGQMYFWDETLATYEKTGVSRKGGVYTYNNTLSNTIGATAQINKSDLTEIVKPSVEFMDGSEVVGTNHTRAVIIKSNKTTVTVRTIVDLVIDSFVQVATESDLPTSGVSNVLYFIKDQKVFKVWDNGTYKLHETRLFGNKYLFTIDYDINHKAEFTEYYNTIIRHYVEKYGFNKILLFISETPAMPGNALSAGTASKESGFYQYGYSMTDSVDGRDVISYVFVQVGTEPIRVSKESSVSNLSYTRSAVKFSVYADNLDFYDFSNTSWDVSSRKILETDQDYSIPYMPHFDGSPATKKYVDSKLASFVGNEYEYNQLTEEEKNSYLTAFVTPVAEPSELDLNLINETISAEVTPTTVDITDEELLTHVDSIIGGAN